MASEWQARVASRLPPSARNDPSRAIASFRADSVSGLTEARVLEGDQAAGGRRDEAEGQQRDSAVAAEISAARIAAVSRRWRLKEPTLRRLRALSATR